MLAIGGEYDARIRGYRLCELEQQRNFYRLVTVRVLHFKGGAQQTSLS